MSLIAAVSPNFAAIGLTGNLLCAIGFPRAQVERIADLKVKQNGGARDRLPPLPTFAWLRPVATAVSLKLAPTAHLSAG